MRTPPPLQPATPQVFPEKCPFSIAADTLPFAPPPPNPAVLVMKRVPVRTRVDADRPPPKQFAFVHALF